MGKKPKLPFCSSPHSLDVSTALTTGCALQGSADSREPKRAHPLLMHGLGTQEDFLHIYKKIVFHEMWKFCEVQILASISKVLNFVNKNFAQIHFLSHCTDIYTRAWILPFGLPKPTVFAKWPFKEKIFWPWCIQSKTFFYRHTRTCMFLLWRFVYKRGIVWTLLWQSSVDLKPLNMNHCWLWG